MEYKIPQEVKEILEKLESAKFEAFLVGGCVRDLLMGRAVSDWDVTTNAKPDEIQRIFPDSFYENDFGTVGIKTRTDTDKTQTVTDKTKVIGVRVESEPVRVVEVTPYRKEAKYSDKRHPDRVEFTASLEEDLARRDFTINAIAMRASHQPPATSIVDPFNGQRDIKAKLIRSVGNARDRFDEDALRLMRAVRFAAQLGFAIESETEKAIQEKSGDLRVISKERIRDEFLKIIDSPNAEQGVRSLQELGLLKYIIPELEEGIGVEQGKHHKYTVFEHAVRSLGYAAKFGYNTTSRLAALFHDIAKPRTRRQEPPVRGGAAPNYTFYGHEVVGSRMTTKILERLRFPKNLSEKVVTLVRYHRFYYDVGEVSARSVRRIVKKVGPENIRELIETRIAERKGSGVPKAEPYRLRHLQYMMEKVQKDPLTVGMLAVRGEDVMKELKIEPGPRIGMILNTLLEEVLDDPKRNTKENLESRIKELGKLPDTELKKLAEAGKEKLEGRREEIDRKIKGKYYVK